MARLLPNPNDVFRKIDGVVESVDEMLAKVAEILTSVEGTLGDAEHTLAATNNTLNEVKDLLAELRDELGVLDRVPEMATQLTDVQTVVRALADHAGLEVKAPPKARKTSRR